MRLLLQTNRLLNEAINRYGCNFMSLLGIPQFVENKKLRPEDIMDLYEYVREQEHGDKPFMLDDCTVKWPNGIINAGFEQFNSSKYGRQVGSLGKGTVTWWGTPRKISCAVGVYKTSFDNEHYILLDHNLEELYDPNPEVQRRGRKYTILYYVGPDHNLL